MDENEIFSELIVENNIQIFSTIFYLAIRNYKLLKHIKILKVAKPYFLSPYKLCNILRKYHSKSITILFS